MTALLGWAAGLAGRCRAAGGRRPSAAPRWLDSGGTTPRSPWPPRTGRRASSGTTCWCSTDGFPGRRSVTDAAEPERALEEERRLAYVAWTRARRSLTLLYDPEAPSQFLEEAFDPDELGVGSAASAA